MNVVPVTAEGADEAAERNRLAWNLPRPPLVEVPRVSPGSPAPIPPRELASSSPRTIVTTPDDDSTEADVIALQGLDWQGFLSRYFPGRRRHDLEALTAYGAYRSTKDVAEGSPGEVVRLDESRSLLPEATAADTWADDGGTTR